MDVRSLRSVPGRSVLRVVLAVALAVGAWSVYRALWPDYREVRLAVPAASGLEPLMDVRIGGRVAGRIQGIELEDGDQPIVTIGLDRDAPAIHEDASVVIEYKSLLGERYIAISPGSPDAPELPEGALLGVSNERVDIDQVLQVLGSERREHLVRLIGNARDAVEGRGDQIGGVLDGGGPAVANTSQVLAELGEDQEALRRLMTSTSQLVGELSARRDEVGRVVEQTSAGVREIADESDSLARGLEPLPDTLAKVESTLVDLDGAVEATVPLLRDLQPVTAELPGLAGDLRPTLTDLRSTVADLRPVLATAPPALDDLTTVLGTQVPPLGDAGTSLLDQAIPIVDFLRPYAPEVAGWATNWAGSATNYDADGYYVRVPGVFGRSSVAGTPVKLTFSSLPGQRVEPNRAPGQLEGQPVHGANRPPEELR